MTDAPKRREQGLIHVLDDDACVPSTVSLSRAASRADADLFLECDTIGRRAPLVKKDVRRERNRIVTFGPGTL